MASASSDPAWFLRPDAWVGFSESKVQVSAVEEGSVLRELDHKARQPLRSVGRV